MFLRHKLRRKDGKEHRYWSIVENRRVSGGRTVQRHVLYLGEINDNQRAAWCRTIEAFDEAGQGARQIALFPEDRAAPTLDCDVVQVRLSGLRLRRPRQWGACWLTCHLWEQLRLDDFWSPRLTASRQGTRWLNVLGQRIGAIVLYLLHYQLLPEKRLAEAMAHLFGVHLVTATIARISQDCAQRFQSFADAVRDHVAAAPVKHMDETGFRIGGKTQWLHVASTILLTFYRVSPKRGSLLAHVTGIVVHDHWKPYYTLKGVLHGLCNAHHLRELKALVEIEKED